MSNKIKKIKNLLLDNSHLYKPTNYEFAFNAFKQQCRMFWLPEEASMTNDLIDMQTNLTDGEKNLVIHIFRFFTQSDIEVGGKYCEYLTIFKPVEVRMMLTMFVAVESVHIEAYAFLIKTLNIPDSTFSAFLEYKELNDKFDFLQSFDLNNKFSIALSLAVFSAFVEGLQLFASFAMLLNFQRFGLLQGVNQIVTWSLRDECLHIESMIRLYHEFIKENKNEINLEELNKQIVKCCKTIVFNEIKFIEIAYSVGEIRGCTKEDLIGYLHYMADYRLKELNIKPIFNQTTNPCSWIDKYIFSKEIANFFETSSTEYNHGGVNDDLV